MSVPAEVQAAKAAALFDGTRLAAAADSPSPAPEDPLPARGAYRRLRRAPYLSSRLARWTGAAALYSIWRDGVLVQRYAAQVVDHSLSPSRRASSARLLAGLGRVEAVPTLGWAVENDPSPRVRRLAQAVLLDLVRAEAPRLLRTLKFNPRAGPREAAAATLSWLVRHDDAPEAVEALAAAGMLDRSEDARLAAIRSLAAARSPKAFAALEWMLSAEERPHMRSALELALADARRLRGPAALQRYRPPEDEFGEVKGPLHEVALKRALAAASVFVAIELIGGFLTGNVALKADAAHLAADQIINAAALFSIWMARRPPNSRKSYGYLKVESVVGLLGALAIGLMGLEMAHEALGRLLGSGQPATWSVALFALASLASNAITATLLWRHHGDSMSVKGAFLHSLTDAIGSVGVILSVAAAILLGWTWVEPVAVALIVVMIVRTSWELGKPAWGVLIDAVPDGVDLDRIEADLLAVPGAVSVRDLHVWALNSRTTAFTATVLVRPGSDHDQVLASAKALLREKHKITHATVQVETIAAAP